MATRGENTFLKAVIPILILKALLVSPKHGYEIARSFKNSEHNIDIDIASVYRILNKLKDNGYVIEEGNKVIVDNRARTYFAVTEEGHLYYKQQMDEIAKVYCLIHSL